MIDKSNWSPVNLSWMAGLLEGEGCFSYDAPALQVRCQMTDEDVVRKLHLLAGFGNVNEVSPPVKYPNHKTSWEWKSRSSADVHAFELAILPYMGERRTQKILDCHEARRHYELTATGNHHRRVFPSEGS